MPVVEKEDRRNIPIRSACLVYGVGGCAALFFLVIAILGVGYYLLVREINRGLSSALSGPPAHPKPYKSGLSGVTAECKVPLPDASGIVIYRHGLGDGRVVHKPYEGERDITLLTKSLKKVDCPLGLYSLPNVYHSIPNVRVGFYWYPAENGKGPYLRLYDSCEETIVDLSRGVTQHLYRESGHIYIGDRIPGYCTYSAVYDTSGKIIGFNINGKPAVDATRMLGKGKGQYIGSVVRVGNKLLYKPANRKLDHQKSKQ